MGSAIFRKPDYLALIVQAKSVGVVAARQIGKRGQCPIFPDGREALTMGAVLAKVFPIRIHRGSLGTNRRLATPIRPAGPTIACGASDSAQCAEVAQGAAAIPKKSVLGAPASQVRGSGHPACIVHLKSRAIRPGPA